MRNYKFPAILLISLSFAAARLEAQIAAFPGAVGFGGTATGAATLSGANHVGGTVYHVTNLNDSGAGSFRTGVGTSGNIVVFDVGGSIRNLSPVSAASNLTIAGQTAPGGIQVFGAETSFYGQSNIICRYVHFRDGTLDPNYPGPSATNSHTNAASLGNTANVIMDHCSFEFAAYNNVDAVGAVNTTFQNCIFARPIAEQRFDCHFETGPVTFIDNLWADSHGRNPLGKADIQFVNNIVYNYGYAVTTGNSSGVFSWDVLDNFFISGPSTTSPGDAFYQVDSNQSAYAAGNYLDGNANGVLNGSTDNTVNGATVSTTEWSPTTGSLPTLSATAAYYTVVSNAGPVPRDQVDSQVVDDVLSLGAAGMLWTSQSDTGLENSGYGVITGGTALPDSDGSGMPDDWKAAMGLSMTNPAVGGVTSSTGYTNLENYLNWKALPNAWVPKNTPSQHTSVTIDLSQYTNGFAVGSTFTVSNLVKGAVTQSGSGGFLVNFVPTSGTAGLGGFNWSVTNGVTTMTSTCGVLISQSGPSQSVTWKGDGVTNAWNLGAANWTSVSTGSASDFATGDPVTFNDTGSASPAVNIDTSVSPGSITLNTYANNYTLSGSGTIAGSGALVKEGTASLTISNSGGNTFSGGAVLDGGAVYLNNGAGLGSGTTTLNGADLEISSNISAGMPIAVNVPSTLGLDAHGSDVFLGGAVSGAGALALNFNSSGIIFTPSGSWSSYTGTLNVSGGGTLRLDNSGAWGIPNAVVNLEGAVALYNRASGAATIPLGALNGVSSSSLGGSDQSSSAGTTATYIIGSLNLPSTFAGSIANSGNQTVAITGTGTSTLTLSGASTYTGPTTIWNTLLLTGTLGNTDLTISSGATLISKSLVSGTVTLAGGSLYLGNSTAPGVIGTLTAGNAFVVDGGTIYYDLSSSPTATGSNDLITVTAGSLSLHDAINFEINMTNGVLGSGTYSLISGGATLGVSYLSMNLALPIPAGGVTRQSFGLVRPASGSTPGYVNLVVAGSAGSLTWTGATGATWDLNTTGDWSGGTTSTFFDLDTVAFNDTDTGGTVNLSGTLAPNVAYVTNNVTNYTFSGTGGLAGNAVLIKSGSASLTINNTGNTFTGPIYLDGGTMYVNQYLGAGTIYLNGGTLVVGNGVYLGNSIVVDTSSTIDAQGGSDWLVDSAGATLSSTSAVTLYVGVGSGSAFTIANNMNGFQGTFELGSSSGLVRLNGSGSALALFDLGTSTAWMGNRNGGVTENFGAVEGGPGTTLSGRTTGSGDTASTYIVGALNTNNTFAGSIVTDGDLGGLNIIKVGTGNWTLSGTSSFVGDFLVQQGTLTISGSDNNGGLDFEAETGATLNLAGGTISTESVQIDQGAFLTGYGTINGSLVNEGTNSLSTATGTVTVNGTLTVNGNLENDGIMTVASGGVLLTTLAVDGGATFVNNGTLDLRNSPQTVLPYGYVNNGAILTSGSLLVIQALVWTGDGVTNAWNLSAPNWTSLVTGSAAAFSTDDPITFTDGGSTSPAVKITGRVSPQSIEVSGTASNYVLSGTGGIGGAGGLEKDSAGTLTLATADSYTGPTLLNSGTLQLQANSGNTTAGVSSALSSSSMLTLGANTTLGLFGNTNKTIFAPAGVVEADSNGPFNFYVANNGSGTGNTLILANLGQFGYPATSPTFNLSGSNGYTLQLGAGSAGTGALYFYNNTTLNSNTPGVTLSIPGGLIVNYPSGYTLAFGGAGNIIVGPIINDGYPVTPNFVGSGKVTLTGSDSFGGATATLTSGTLALDNAGSLGGINALAINGGALDNTTAGSLTETAGPAVTIGGNFAFGGTQSLNLGTGAVANSGSRTITLNGAGVLTFGGVMTNTAGAVNTLTVNNGAGVTSTTAISFGGYALSNSATSYTDIIKGSANVNISGPVTNGGTATACGLTYAGTGVLTLSGSGTYTGPTVVSSGTLEITGAVAGTASVSVSNGAELYLVGGSLSAAGSITNNGTVKLSGTSPVTSTGSFLNNGTLELNDGASLPANFVNNGTVISQPAITSALKATGTVGKLFTYTITASNNPTHFTVTVNGPAPTGWIINPSTGMISGTPAGTGTFTGTLIASNAAGTGSATGILTVVPAPPSAAIASPSSIAAISSAPSGDIIAEIDHPTSYAGSGVSGLINFTDAAGTFAGLIDESVIGGGTFHVGYAEFTLAGAGRLTGKLIYAGATLPIDGRFDTNGIFSGLPLNLGLRLSSGAEGGGYWIAGLLSGRNGSVSFQACHAAYAQNEAVPETGGYTILLSGTDTGALIPQGTGYAFAAVAKTGGTVIMSGKLADGTAFSVSGILVKGPDGDRLPLFDPGVYGSKGLLAGSVVFEHLAGSDCNGALEWTRPATTGSGALYPQGFDTNLDLTGSIYVNPGDGASLPLLMNGALTLTLTDGGLSVPISQSLGFSPQGLLIVTGSNPYQLEINVNPSSGGISGSFVHPRSLAPVSFSCVLDENVAMPGAGGFFIGPILSGTSLSGNVILSP